MKRPLARFFLWLASKLGGYESDLDYRARLLNMQRLPPSGGRDSIEQAILNVTPPPLAVEFDWRGREELVVRFRGAS